MKKLCELSISLEEVDGFISAWLPGCVSGFAECERIHNSPLGTEFNLSDGEYGHAGKILLRKSQNPKVPLYKGLACRYASSMSI